VDSGDKQYAVASKSPPKTAEIQVFQAFRFDKQSRLLCLGVLPSGSPGIVRFSDDGKDYDVVLEAKLGHRCCISADGSLVATTGERIHSQPQAIEIWSTSSKSVIQRLPGHAGEITALAFSADNKLLASATEFGEIKVWDVQSLP
jgi:WD40 repeat protein